MFNFEKLEVWQKAIAFAGLVYRLTRLFPPDERFGLTNQIRRAAVSISSNIAEGAKSQPRPQSPTTKAFLPKTILAISTGMPTKSAGC